VCLDRSRLLRTDGFEHVADIMVGSFYAPDLDEGCAFEELISFHGGIGGVQTRPFILHPSHLEVPEPIIGRPASTASYRAGGMRSSVSRPRWSLSLPTGPRWQVTNRVTRARLPRRSRGRARG
jgi:hypothetical protein